MALPTAYLTSTKNLESILDAIKNAKAPDKFTTRFLESLDFKSTSDRLIIGVLKSLGFLDSEGRPKERYFKFLDQTQAAFVLAEALEETYADIYQTNKAAHNLSKQELINKLKTLSQGQFSESVLDKISMTFLALAKLADFQKPSSPLPSHSNVVGPEAPSESLSPGSQKIRPPLTLGGLHYNIQIILPESRDPKVYDVLFRSLREHLVP